MRFRFLAVPVQDGEEAEAELNHFIATHRVLSVERALVADGVRSVWAVCVAWSEASDDASAATDDAKKGRVDYKEVLPKDEDGFPGFSAERFTAGLTQAAAPDVVRRYTEHARCFVAHKRRTTSGAALMTLPGVTLLRNPGPRK